jgi:hypothetical protein
MAPLKSGKVFGVASHAHYNPWLLWFCALPVPDGSAPASVLFIELLNSF